MLAEVVEAKLVSIGQDYANEDNPLKGALFLLESTYNTAVDDPLGIQWWIDGGKDWTFTRLFEVCSGRKNAEVDAEERGEFWSRIAFYNFVPRSLGSENRRPLESEFKESARVFDAVLKYVAPRAVWILGKTQAYYSEPIIKANGISYCVCTHPARAGNQELRDSWQAFLDL